MKKRLKEEEKMRKAVGLKDMIWLKENLICNLSVLYRI